MVELRFTAAELRFEPTMSSPGTQNELSGESKYSPPASPMSSVGHLAPDPWKPYEKHQKEQIFVCFTYIIRMSVGPLKVRYAQSYKKEPKKVHLRWLTRQLQLRLAPMQLP